MGGALTIASLASSNVFSAGAPFYGIPDLNVFKLSNIKVSVMGNFGSKDSLAGFSDPVAAKNLEQKAKEAGVNFTLKMWEGADHAFMNQDSANYHKEFAGQACDMVVEFFKSN